ncbi:uncharacterized protein (DUF885 family) [Aeromicrobium panaciterrae]|uniref:Uncharacterized protein (DUF885 family) n=1 Tax=Aeromicrobium panaciterrae TaxID=363861 RepID=A0ABU1UNJ6_9ACTN|nr:hypothetical protein [Aeromicrobium panaciterrae]MDR7086757.1 uncharacterized protein (DUF885 family) [Aeromicrobium panaciterrae]
MTRTAALLVSTLVCATVLSGCGGGSAYCDAVDKDKASLNTFGEKRTDAAYAGYAKVLEGVAKVAPATIKKDWTTLADVTKGVIAAQKAVDLKLEDMTDTAKVKKLSAAQLKELNAAYTTFNGTKAERTAVVKNVKQECKITLK